MTKDLLLRAQVEQQKILLQLAQAQQQHRKARRVLALLMGGGLDSIGRLAPLPEVDVDRSGAMDWGNAARDGRPELAGAKAQALAAKNMEIDAGLQFLPSVALQGSYSWTNVEAGFDGKQDSWWVGLGAQIPIWDGGIRVHQAREASSRRRQALANVEAVRQQVTAEAEDAWDDWKAAQEALPVAALERDLAAEAFRLAEVRHRAGATRQVELLDARAALQGAELSYLNTEVATRVAGVKLLQSVGKARAWAAETAGR